MKLDILLKLQAGLFIGGFIEEKHKFAAPLVNALQEHATGSSDTRRIFHGILPELFQLKEATMREAHGQGGIDMLHRPFEAKDHRLPFRIGQSGIRARRLRWEDEI